MENGIFENTVVKNEPLFSYDKLTETIKKTEEFFREIGENVIEIMYKYGLSMEEAMRQFGEQFAEMLTPLLIDLAECAAKVINEVLPNAVECARRDLERRIRLTMRCAPRKLGRIEPRPPIRKRQRIFRCRNNC